jgi:enoyl-CoA hydratase
MNSLSSAVIDEFSAVLDSVSELAATDRSIRSLIMTGEGRAFIAGADIKEMHAMDPEEARDFSLRGNSLMQKIEAMELPVIAAVNGFALGGGLETVLACDFAFLSRKARVGLPEATLGIIPGFGGSRRLYERIGRAAAKELIYTGRMIDAEEALRLGIANRVCEPEKLIAEAVAVSEEMEKTSPNSVKEAKSMLNIYDGTGPAVMIGFEADKFGLVFSNPDSVEGKDAFLNKRKPEWRK